MKKAFYFGVLICILLWSSCTELGPNINITNPNGNTGAQDRVVLIEEFTGVRCVNCPEGSEQIENLLGIHGDQLIAVSIHSGFFSNPYPESLYDFRVSEGESIETYLGPASGYPIAVVDRKLYSGESELMVGRNKWAGYVAQQKLESPKVNIEITNNYSDSNRQLDVAAQITFNEDVTEPLKISVMLVEDGVADVQLTPDGKVSDYNHKHILRDMMTAFDGDNYNGTTTAQSTSSESFSMTIPNEWDVNKCSVIVFVHEYISKKDVLQAAYSKVTE